MNLSDLQAKLLRVARANPPDAAVPYAFEKRIMARIASPRPESAWALWGVSLWRGAVACMAVTLLCAFWAYSSAQRQTESAANFSQSLEATVFASMDQPVEDSW